MRFSCVLVIVLEMPVLYREQMEKVLDTTSKSHEGEEGYLYHQLERKRNLAGNIDRSRGRAFIPVKIDLGNACT